MNSYWLCSVCVNKCYNAVLRSGDAEAEYVRGGTGDASVFTGVAEFFTETRWSCIH